MSHREENARLSHELEQAEDNLAASEQENRDHCDHIAALQSRETELKRQFEIAMNQNLEQRVKIKNLNIEVAAFRNKERSGVK